MQGHAASIHKCLVEWEIFNNKQIIHFIVYLPCKVMWIMDILQKKRCTVLKIYFFNFCKYFMLLKFRTLKLKLLYSFKTYLYFGVNIYIFKYLPKLFS